MSTNFYKFYIRNGQFFRSRFFVYFRFIYIFVLFIGTINAQSRKSKNSEPDDETTDQCPEPNGYFADAEQCDKYYECRDGAITEKLCPDGMVFNDFSIEYEKCDLPYNIDCSKRPKLRKFLLNEQREL